MQVISTHKQGLQNSATANERKGKAKLKASGGNKNAIVGVASKLNAEE